jgi:hypothetical protein
MIQKITSMYYDTFSRFLLLLERRKNDYNYGMAVVLFTYTIALFFLPIIITLLRLIHLPRFVFFEWVIVSFILLWILNFLLTRKRHKALYAEKFDEMRGQRKYSVLLVTLLGMVCFIGYCILILRK